MAYVKLHDGQVQTYPYSVGRLRRDNPNISFPRRIHERTLVEFGVFPVTVPDDPTYDPDTQRILTSAQPSLIDGVWVLVKTVVPLTTEELALAKDKKELLVRSERNKLLAGSDWTQVADAPVDQAAWATYRQSLRDIPQQDNFPHNVVWPVKPTA